MKKSNILRSAHDVSRGKLTLRAETVGILRVITPEKLRQTNIQGASAGGCSESPDARNELIVG